MNLHPAADCQHSYVCALTQNICVWCGHVQTVSDPVTSEAEPGTRELEEHVDVVEATFLGGTHVEVTFTTNETGIVDFSDFMYGPLYEELLNTEQLKDLRVDSTLGTIVWRNGLDVAPEILYTHAMDRSTGS